MPYLHLDLPGVYPAESKRALAERLCGLYSEVMQTERWRPNVGICELGKDIVRPTVLVYRSWGELHRALPHSSSGTTERGLIRRLRRS